LKPVPALPKHKFDVLDALRGIAALFVAARHFGYPFSGSYLAVDLFFVLSGFVLAHAYEERLSAGMSLREFLTARFIRLTPLYFLALVIAVIGAYREVSPIDLITILAFSLLFLPSPIGALGLSAGSFPLIPQSWSLFFELAANTLHALLAKRLTDRILLSLIGAALVALIITCASGHPIDGGWQGGTDLLNGFPRVVFSYFAGVLLCRLYRSGWQLPPINAWILFGILVACEIAPIHRFRIPADLVTVTIIFPLLVFAAASSTLGRISSKLLLPLGYASYAIYVLHVPLGRMLFDQPNRLVEALFLSALVVVSVLLDAYFDVPIRRWLTTVTKRKPKPVVDERTASLQQYH
jgi:peptidoglycan/LPS O-acetylase OafA/YrhL